MNQTPKYSEFRGFYNVSPSGEDDPRLYLCTTPGLKRPDFHEIDRLADWFVSINRTLSRKRREGQPTSSVNRAVSYNVGFDDRTALLTVENPQDLTEELLESIRRYLEVHEPLWRVVVAGEDDDSTIVVYPSAIEYPNDSAPSQQLIDIRRQAQAARDRTAGVRERQMAYVKMVLKSDAPLKKPPYKPQIVCAFDVCSGDPECVCIWVMQDGRTHLGRNSLPLEETPDGFVGVCGGTLQDVSVDGTVTEFMTAGDDFVGELQGLAYSKKLLRDHIDLVDPDTGEKLRYAVSTDSLLSDEFVRHRLRLTRKQD